MRLGSADCVIQDLYHAAATLADDEPALDALGRWVNVEHVVLCAAGPSEMLRTSRHIADMSMADRLLGVAEMSKLSVIAPHPGAFFRHTDYGDRAALSRERLYRELLHKYDGGLSAFAYWSANGTFNAAVFCRSLRSGIDFDESELLALQAILPHIAAVQLIRHNLGRANQIAEASGRALSGLHQALFLIDPSGQLAYRNERADELLGGGDSFLLTSRGLSCHAVSAAARLAAAVSALQRLSHLDLRAPIDPSAASAFVVPRPGRSALSVSVLPVSGMTLLAGTGLDPRWVAVLVSDPQRSAEEAVTLLAARCHLTLRESQLVALLASGQSLPSAAATLDVTHETARQYLKTIFSKTGVHRQADLVRLASRLSA